ncbi:MAG: hypothetical protein LBR55_00855 [Bacteroidales bacterium]|jgi:hypothetical protein|nr:hypothetical protein [Bacteroidales bacterium]
MIFRPATGTSVFIPINGLWISGETLPPPVLEAFNDFLLQVKAKYIEWSEVAKANNITEVLNRNMDIILSPLVGLWCQRGGATYNDRLS